MQQGDKF